MKTMNSLVCVTGLGIMVWQDFAMGCALYPQTQEFLESIRREAVSVIRKLRNHPSIVLWSGDNECDAFYLDGNGLDPANNRITREILPQAVFQCDPYRPYLASSPYYSPAGSIANGCWNSARAAPVRVPGIIIKAAIIRRIRPTL